MQQNPRDEEPIPFYDTSWQRNKDLKALKSLMSQEIQVTEIFCFNIKYLMKFLYNLPNNESFKYNLPLIII